MRGIAALLVVIVHVINSADYRASGKVGDIGSAALSEFLYFNNIGTSGVDLFFVISGFVMALIMRQNADRKVTEFAWNRFVRIFPFFWIIGTAYIGFSYLIGLPVSARGILNTYLLLPVTDFGDYSAPTLVVGWSLAFELIFYGLVAGSLQFTHKTAHLMLIFMLLLLSVLGLIFHFPVGILSIIFNPVMLEFALGIGVFMLWEKYRNSPWATSIGTISLILGMILILASVVFDPQIDVRHTALVDGSTSFKRVIIWGFPWALTVFGVLLREASLVTNPGYLARAVQQCGDASYAIYLMHMFTCMYAERQMIVSGFNPDLLIATLFLASVLIGFIVHFWFEKPLIRWLRANDQWRARITRGRPLRNLAP